MAVRLGGQAAESLVFGEVSTGAADDLNKATDIARNMVTRFGMHASPGAYRCQLEEGATRLLAKETLTRDALPVLEAVAPASVDGPGVSVRG